ncbi:DUF805 domain-containing protein [Campylobacter geochelonis]|uniref:Inner membrane protein yhaI n=1 Tax=Campylobacter geochelonis TaxID=1780362 RepID=A0A128EKV6_9BACT|nr:DUF805 domain-containing protein [Campylobacter geochelonis]QKF71261.1 DUF805 domain-containing membrane protein [Campylobacter geochelonis]CZE48155.1 Inner membrane protein yhaI [Campylobacter geochelonis]CZE49042.1 Inner membrane protein yhaI [Campylobacter geochelonis]CZE51120.1 Inner membrane protein yhaI [Campylobacter geochelonis]
MSAFGYFKKVYAEYFNFNGRARRKEYWYYTLFYTIISIVLGTLDLLIFDMEILSSIFFLVSLIPYLAVSARRLHDIGKSGWWLLIGIIPILGGIVLLVFFIIDGEQGDNEYGLDPKREYSF